ncbi:MAG: extracellular solute-binding protein [Deltaproteobacteria bacterium]|nr:extracellular solute-binding protein [Deltaproteobacteria bacterium]
MKIFLYFSLILGSCLMAGIAFAQNARLRPGEWDTIVEAGRKEGKVVVSVPVSPELRKDFERAFKQRFGIEAELITGRAAAIVAKIQQEAKAGVQSFDLHIGGSESLVTGLLSESMLEPFDPAMILPEVKNPANWWGGHLWVDNAKRYIYTSLAYVTENLWYHADQVKPDEIRSFNDLLHPKWSGKIGYLDPRTPGSGSSLWSFLWQIKGEAYLRKLVAQKMFIGRDQRQLAENLAKGTNSLVIGLTYYSFAPFIKAGLPVKPLPNPPDEVYVSGGSGNISIIKGAPHPNAAKVFVNWFLSREGQDLFSRVLGQGTRRLDVDTHWLKDVGVMAAKDVLSPDQYSKLENQSEDKIVKVREPAAQLARKLLD